MPTRPMPTLLLLVLLLGAVALLVAAVTSGQAGPTNDPGRVLFMLCGATLAGLGGFKVGRMMASGQLSFGARLCRSCNARRTTRAAFCESCHRRD